MLAPIQLSSMIDTLLLTADMVTQRPAVRRIAWNRPMPIVTFLHHLLSDPWNPTMATGVIVYSMAWAACAWAWWTARSAGRAQHGRLSWLLLTVIQFLLVLDMRLSVRHQLSDVLSGLARAEHWYNQRRWPQIVALGVLALAGGVLILLLLRGWRRSAPVAVASAATVVSVMLFLASVISAHVVDAVFYADVGPLCAVAFGWIIAAGTTAAGALCSRERLP